MENVDWGWTKSADKPKSFQFYAGHSCGTQCTTVRGNKTYVKSATGKIGKLCAHVTVYSQHMAVFVVLSCVDCTARWLSTILFTFNSIFSLLHISWHFNVGAVSWVGSRCIFLCELYEVSSVSNLNESKWNRESAAVTLCCGMLWPIQWKIYNQVLFTLESGTSVGCMHTIGRSVQFTHSVWNRKRNESKWVKDQNKCRLSVVSDNNIERCRVCSCG